jgi:hypothetical protein
MSIGSVNPFYECFGVFTMRDDEMYKLVFLFPHIQESDIVGEVG